jgi:predicted aldo/keto reductase-like oxidoreductase
MEQVATAAAEDGRFDVMLFVYNYLQREQGERILKVCREKNVGTTLMKTNPILNYLEFQEIAEKEKAAGREVPDQLKNILPRLKERADAAEAFKKEHDLTDFDQVRDAAVRFVLSNPNVNTACLTIKNFKDLEFYTALSGARFGSVEERALEIYRQSMGQFYCRHACGVCESQCPHQVPVNTIMRYDLYFKGQGREKTAMQNYASLPTSKADKCRNCDGHCERACPFGVPVQGLLALAHDTLTLA